MTKAKFRDVPAGDYFFLPGSTVPHHKVSETHSVEAGSAYNRPTDPDERVLHIRFTEDGRLKIGIYTLPRGLSSLPTYAEYQRAKQAEDYVDERLEAEQASKKPSGA